MRLATLSIAVAISMLAAATVYATREPEPTGAQARAQLAATLPTPPQKLDDPIAAAIVRAYARPLTSEQANRLAAEIQPQQAPAGDPVTLAQDLPQAPTIPAVTTTYAASLQASVEAADVHEIAVEMEERVIGPPEADPSALAEIADEQQRIVALEDDIDQLLAERELASRQQRQQQVLTMIAMDQRRRELMLRAALAAAVGARTR